MSDSVNKTRFIPYRRSDIVRLCLQDEAFSDTELAKLKDVFNLLQSIYHFQFHQVLETLKDCYAPVNPDADTKSVFPYTAADIQQLESQFFTELHSVLDKANFEAIQEQDLAKAMSQESLFKIKLDVDFDDFEQILFYWRGESKRKETLRSVFGLHKRVIEFINYDRVVIVVKYKSDDYFIQQGREKLNFKPGSTIIKLFRNVPHADLEMLFPNTEVRMKAIDKIIIGVPAAVGGVAILVTKLGATLVLSGALIGFWLGLREEPVELNQTNLLVLGAGFATIGGFLWKQFSNFKNRKIRFMKTLADNLYFKNLDNNVGVFHRLIDAAEEEEAKEAILAYYFLCKSGKALTLAQLDRMIEQWFTEQLKHILDFEVHDAVSKLAELKLVECQGKHFKAVEPSRALMILDKIWDGYFQYQR